MKREWLAAIKLIGKELCKLGDAVATSLGCIVIAVAVFLAIALFMCAIYCRPPEKHSEVPSCGASHGSGIPVHLIANPVHKWHPVNVNRR